MQQGQARDQQSRMPSRTADAHTIVSVVGVDLVPEEDQEENETAESVSYSHR